MTRIEPARGILRRDSVRVVDQAALVECGHDTERPGSSITVVPLIDDSRVVGFEIRCGCGNTAVVECVYTKEVDHVSQ